MPSGKSSSEVSWSPQVGPQHALVRCYVPEILFGGARGGGKTDGVLGKWGRKALSYGPAFNAVFFRQEMPQQDDLIERAKEIYLPTGAVWKDSKKTFTMAAGGRIRFRPLESVADAVKYQGQNLTDAAVEEAGNYDSPTPIDMLWGALRSGTGIYVQMILTANPGGVGHQWIKARYVDPAPLGMKVLSRYLPDGREHRYVFIPSKVQNNKILMQNDPGYVSRLYLVGSPELVKAWLAGDWNAISGAYFPEFSIHRHVIAPFAIPPKWTRFRAMDWGSAKPFSIGWYAVSDGTLDLPKGALVKYREWYGAAKDNTGATIPNVGLVKTADWAADGVLEREKKGEVNYGVADPAMWKVDGGPSIAERMIRKGVTWRKADNSRINGWDQVRDRLVGDDDEPMIYFFPTCIDTIRTLPSLQHDDNKAEDLDSDGEDHAADELRYACMSRPFVRTSQHRKPGPKPGTYAHMMKITDDKPDQPSRYRLR